MSDKKDAHDFLTEVAEQLLPQSRKRKGEFPYWLGPSILEEVHTGEFPLGALLNEEEFSDLNILVSGVIGLLVARHFGDLDARRQLNVIEKFLFPKKYEVPAQVIEKLSRRYESGHLVRAWALYRLIHRLGDLVIIEDPHPEDMLKSRVVISPEADQSHSLYPYVVRYWKWGQRGRTLENLAIYIYLALAKKSTKITEEDPSLNVKSLQRDLRKLRRREEADHAHMKTKKRLVAGGADVSVLAHFPTRKYSESFVPVADSDGAAEQGKGRAGVLTITPAEQEDLGWVGEIEIEEIEVSKRKL
jgi:hypothetical protein